ncbi:MAG: DUF192 domain-containing protein [Deltaproteobacteria bacterium]|jgi:uncharacterized membrane protein (UPF0127 family)
MSAERTCGLGHAWVVALLLTACAGTEDDGRDRIEVTVAAPDPVTFLAEVADTTRERQVGLMGRAHLEPDHGMLFVFPDEEPRAFWMKDTPISLDMIFIRADRRILGIVDEAEPNTTLRRSVPGDSQFVLEINGGLAKSLGIDPGQLVTFTATVPDS